MKRTVFAAVACALALAAAGCVLPGKFAAKMDIGKDGSYRFDYQGSVVCLAMLSDMVDGVLDEDGEASLAEQIQAEMKKDENLSSVSYAGGAVFNVVYKASGNVGQRPLLVGMRDMPFFVLDPSSDGAHAVFRFLPEWDPDMVMDDLPASAFSPQGTIELTTELPVESSVGDPARAMLSNTYTWKVDGIDGPLPAMTLKLK